MVAQFSLPQALAWLAAVCVLASSPVPTHAQSSSQNPDREPRRRIHLNPSDGPNQATDTDLAAGRLIDSLFDPLPPADSLPAAASRALGLPAAQAAKPSNWQGRLARNPKPADGRPPYVLIDHYGGIKRYVEPNENIDLEAYLGSYITVRRDTGDTLLASQLVLPRNPAAAENPRVRLAQHAEEVPPGNLVPTPADGSMPEAYSGMADEEMLILPEGSEPLYLDEGLHLGGCPDCGSNACATSPCGYGSRPILYVRGQYLAWWMDGMETPPLVIQDPVDSTFQNASVIYGGDKILEEGRNGGRILVGYWLDDYGNWAIEGDYLRLEQLNEQFVAGALDGLVNDPAIGRPFISGFNTDLDGDGDIDLPAGQAVEEVDTDGLDGTVTVDVNSEFRSAGVRMRHGLCCSAGCTTGCGDGVSCGTGIGCGTSVGWGGVGPKVGVRRIDAIFGVRWAQLNEGLRVTEDLVVRADDTTFLLRDSFGTSNEFVGGEVGVVWEWEHRRWSLEMLSKIAIGNTRQRVNIAGSTLRDAGQPTELLSQGGLLALPSNIGTYTRDQFGVLPELGITAGYLLTDRLRFNIGYTFLYWSNVVRPGQQIDNVLDVSQIPRFEATAPPGAGNAVAPRFDFQEIGLWAQGINLGFDYRW